MFGLVDSFVNYFVCWDAVSERLHYLFNANRLFRLRITRRAIGVNCQKIGGLCQGMGLASSKLEL
jgi:hypothetical protein